MKRYTDATWPGDMEAEGEMSQTRAEIEAEYEAACRPLWDAFDAVAEPLIEALCAVTETHRQKRNAALAELDAAERAAAEKGKP